MVFKPKFRITNRTLNNLTSIAAAREVILSASILPKWEIRLQRDALVKRVHHSTSIEGNPLTIEQVRKLIEGRDVAAEDKDKQEVLNYVKVLDYIDELSNQKKKAITEEVILQIHKLTTRSILEPSKSGRYRKIMVYVTNVFGEVEYTPPKAEKVPEMMKGFVEWLAGAEASETHPVLASGIAHHELVRIHPFVDGNGRTARALATLILYQRGFDTKRFFALDDYYNENRLAYYAALQKGSPSRKELTGWLEYFTSGVAYSMNKVREIIDDIGIEGRKDRMYLTQRQIWVVKHLQTNPRLTIREIQDKFKISRFTANEVLKPLIKNKIIKRRGGSRSTYYTFK